MVIHMDFQNVLFSIGSAFLYYVNHFKLYSSFCASHSKAQKVLHPSEYQLFSILNNKMQIVQISIISCFFILLLIWNTNGLFMYLLYIFFFDVCIGEGNHALQEFLIARNPKQQHSSTLESYLIKPIQRILKYPLLLQQLRNLTDPTCEEHLHLVGEFEYKRISFSI